MVIYSLESATEQLTFRATRKYLPVRVYFIVNSSSDNESFSWDLKMGLRGRLDQLPVAHAGPILALNWFAGGVDHDNLPSPGSEGWVATGGLDRCVKVR